jgi:beta-glucanase (GH16 family)
LGNDELQFYTDRTHNAALDGDSHLVITAREDASGGPCWYGACRFTSARLITKGTFAQAYGRFEARIRLPRGQGIWPAFWLLGDDIDAVGWPACGEIDIMEYLGHDEDTVHAALHGPGFDPTATFDLAGGGSFADGFRTFAAEWSPDQVRFFVDGHRYGTVDKPDGSGGWVFDHPFFILLNVAVGGRWPGEPDDTTEFPQQMVVDYVRVYEAPE